MLLEDDIMDANMDDIIFLLEENHAIGSVWCKHIESGDLCKIYIYIFSFKTFLTSI